MFLGISVKVQICHMQLHLYFKFDTAVILKIDTILRSIYYPMFSVIQLLIILINDILL